MVRLTGLFAHHLVFVRVDHFLVSFPKVAESVAMTILGRHHFPKKAASFLASVANEKRNNLTRSSAKCYPNPPFEGF
jgi:hypothetical protein